MKIDEFKPLDPITNPFANKEQDKATDAPMESFATLLKQKLNEVDNMQKEADNQAAQVATGDAQYIHQSIIAQEKAYLALQLTVEVRNKMVEAYQEISRMQM